MGGLALAVLAAVLCFGAGSLTAAQEMKCDRWLNDLKPQLIVLNEGLDDLTLPGSNGLTVSANGGELGGGALHTAAEQEQHQPHIQASTSKQAGVCTCVPACTHTNESGPHL